MELSFAPMEGITGSIYRRVHARFFPGADVYYAPFLAPDGTGRFKGSALRELLSENNTGLTVIPQLLVNTPEPFLAAAETLGGFERIRLIEPLDVLDFHNFMSRSYLILTDSGGIQEEAPSLGKPVLVMRDTTERPEGVAAGTVVASEFQPEKELLYGESFGTSDVSRLLGVMLPKDRIPAGQPVYNYVGAGNLPNGQSYEDYKASSAAGLEAVRYYFDGTKLVRIASASYSRNGAGQLVGRKCILKIMDFSGTPDSSKLSMPAGLKAKSLKK